MNKIVYHKVDQDGALQQGRLTFGNIIIETPAVLPTTRTSEEPDDLEFLSNEKDNFTLDQVQGGVVPLYLAPVILEPKVAQQNARQRTATIDNRPRPLDPFSKFTLGNLLICDPIMEHTKKTNTYYDDKLKTNLWFVERLMRYLEEFERRKAEIEVTKTMSVTRLRDDMHDKFWFSSAKSDRMERNKMVEQLVRYQLNYYSFPTPICPQVETVEELEIAIELNEVCQALAYANQRDCMSYILFDPAAIKNKELTAKYWEYVRSNHTTKLDGVKFKDLNLHCPVDERARRGFLQFMKDTIKLKAEHKDIAMMLFDGGVQTYVSMQVFDIVSTSMTGSDEDVSGGGNRKKGEPIRLRWWNQNKMWSNLADGEAPLPDPNHCPYCKITPSFDIDFKVLNRHRRGHRLHDLNKDARDLWYAVPAKNVGVVMRRRLQRAEFSYAYDLILSP